MHIWGTELCLWVKMMTNGYICHEGDTRVPDSSPDSFIQLSIFCVHLHQRFGIYNVPHMVLYAGDAALKKNGCCPLEALHSNYTLACCRLLFHPLGFHRAGLDETIRCLGTEYHFICSLILITSLSLFEQIFLKFGGLKEPPNSQWHRPLAERCSLWMCDICVRLHTFL